MDLFKSKSMKMADSLDWNCTKICKRNKGDTKRVHKSARTKLSKLDRIIITEWENEIIKEFPQK